MANAMPIAASQRGVLVSLIVRMAGNYPPVQPLAFSCSVRRAAIGATMERKRAGVASDASSVVLDM